MSWLAFHFWKRNPSRCNIENKWEKAKVVGEKLGGCCSSSVSSGAFLDQMVIVLIERTGLISEICRRWTWLDLETDWIILTSLYWIVYLSFLLVYRAGWKNTVFFFPQKHFKIYPFAWHWLIVLLMYAWDEYSLHKDDGLSLSIKSC